jgi:membrane protein
MNFGTAKSLAKETFSEWSRDKAPKLAAALAYYTVFSLAPLLIIAIGVASLVFEEEAVKGQLVGQLSGMFGSQGANMIQTAIQNSARHDSGILATIIGFVTLLLGATGVFGELQDSMNTIWDAKPKKTKGILGFLRVRLLSFTMILGVGFLLVVSLLASAVISGLAKYMGGLLPGADFIWQIVQMIVSLGFTTALFAMIFRILPDLKIPWRDVIPGAALTAVIFEIGKFLIGLYLGKSSVASAYGAAGSLVVVLLWVYFAAQILFLGAEFTQVYSRAQGSQARTPEELRRAGKLDEALAKERAEGRGTSDSDRISGRDSGRGSGIGSGQDTGRDTGRDSEIGSGQDRGIGPGLGDGTPQPV